MSHFKHVLLPTDGSDAARSAAAHALALAAQMGARMTALHVIQPFELFAYAPDMLGEAQVQYEQSAQAQAQALMAGVTQSAQAAGVALETAIVTHAQPYEAIIEAARTRGCDLIVMGSHGRRGLSAVLLGSQTQKVLTHCQRPVLVIR